MPLVAASTRGRATSLMVGRYLAGPVRAGATFLRAIPDLIWALIFVSAVGLGPFAGVLALTVHSVGMLVRLFAETIEEMDTGPVDALVVAGASRAQVFSHAVPPELAPTLGALVLYRLEQNERSSLVLGFVGAGGIGSRSSARWRSSSTAARACCCWCCSPWSPCASSARPASEGPSAKSARPGR
jgi:phosphonate transport system permease protein